MIIDTSALLAILQGDPESEKLAGAIEHARKRRLSAGSLVELSILVERQKNPALRRHVNQFLHLLCADIEPVTELQVQIVREAYNAYGQCRGVRAQLNFGDCFA